MKESAPFRQLAGLLRECCVELAVSLAPEEGEGVGSERPQTQSTSRAATQEGAPLAVASFVELEGSSLRAIVATFVSVDFLRDTHPRRHRGVSSDELVGWASELVNQVAGRLVNKLGRRGVSVQIGIPGSLMGREIQLWFPLEDAIVFESEGLRVSLSIESMPSDFDLPVEEQDGCSQEGDLLLF
jgi:hypothetical protein